MRVKQKFAVPSLLLIHRELRFLDFLVTGDLVKLTIVNLNLNLASRLKSACGALPHFGWLQERTLRTLLWQGCSLLDSLTISCAIVKLF